jgi:glycosyltransferase involved in cell wall biosynthesis
MDFQPYHRLPEVLASADVLIATLEAEAGDFAVPSKILSYLCAGRPIILAAPSNNLSTRVISRSGGGYVVNSEDLGQWQKVAKELANNSSLRATLGQRARAYAEATFSIINIAREFESVLTAAYRPNEVRERRLHPVASGQNQ